MPFEKYDKRTSGIKLVRFYARFIKIHKALEMVAFNSSNQISLAPNGSVQIGSQNYESSIQQNH